MKPVSYTHLDVYKRQLYNVGSNGLCAYNPVDKYVYCVLHSKSAVYRFKLTRDTDGWPALDGAVSYTHL